MTGDLGLDFSDVPGFYAAKEIQQLKDELKATSARLAAAEQRAERLAGALEACVPRCDCGEIGVWEWFDNDGQEYKCDKHKHRHFFTYGPEPVPEGVQAKAALNAIKGD